MSDTTAIDASVYDYLRDLAARIRNERGRQDSIQPTELLHEAWAKVVRSTSTYESPAHFRAVAAHAMRQILVDRARARQTVKHGGHLHRTTLAGVGLGAGDPVDLLAVDAALTLLEEVDPRAASIVQLRTFGGLTMEELVAVMGVSERTVRRSWRFGKAWLTNHLAGD